MSTQPIDREVVCKIARTLQRARPKVTVSADEVRGLIQEFASTIVEAGYEVTPRGADGLSVCLDRSTPYYDSKWKVSIDYFAEKEGIFLAVDTGEKVYSTDVTVREFWIEPGTRRLHAEKRSAVDFLTMKLDELLDETLEGDAQRAAAKLQKREVGPGYQVQVRTERGKNPVICARIPERHDTRELPAVLRQTYYQGHRLQISWEK